MWRFGGRADTHVTGVAAAEGKISVNRWYYRQRMESALTRTTRPWVIGIDPGSQTACDCGAGTAGVEMISVNLAEANKRTTVVGIREPKADAQLALFVTGAGWTKTQADGQTHLPQAGKLILDFLKKSRASLGKSKSLVDQSGEGQAVLPFFVSFESGWPDLRDAASCERFEHLSPWRRAAHGRLAFHRRAPRDQSRPELRLVRGKADVLYVADAFAVVAKVNEMLAAGDPA